MAGERDEKFHISVAQVFASSLAAVSAAIVCSYFGVAGTVIGTAIASLFGTVGSALYSFSLRRTRVRLRQLHRSGAASPPLSEVIKTMRQQGAHLLDRVQWAAVGIGTGAVFVFALGIVSVIQDSTNLSGAPLRPHHHRHSPAPAPTVTVTETPTTSPTSSAGPTATATPSSRPTGSATPTHRPSGSPTATPLPSETLTPQPTSTPTPPPSSSPG